MASRKRKGTATNPNKPATKRRKTHAHGKIDPEKFYSAKDIIDEDKTHYLVDWENDSDTGEIYEPTWEPHANLTAKAIADWEAKKSAKKRNVTTTNGEASTKSSPSKRKKSRKVVESSPSKEIGESQDALPGTEDAEESLFVSQSPSQDGGDESHPSSSVVENQVVSELASAADKLVTVQPSDPPSSYQDLAFSSSQVFTGTAPVRESTPEPSQYQPDPVDTSKSTELTTEVSAVTTSPSQQQQTQPVPVNFGETEPSGGRIVPDSQSLPDSSAFRPSTSEGETQSTGGAEVEDRVVETSQPQGEASQVASPSVQPDPTRINRSAEQREPDEEDASEVEKPLASAQGTTSSSELLQREVSAEPRAHSHATEAVQAPANINSLLVGQSQVVRPTAIIVTSGSTQPISSLDVSSLVTRAPLTQPPPASTQLASTESSSFPFQTQVAPVLQPAIDIVSSRSTAETQSSRYDPFDLDVEPSIEAPERPCSSPLSSSAFPSLPVQSVQIGKSAPALPQIPSTPTLSSSSALQSSAPAAMESATPGEILAGTLQELKELRARGRARREAAGAKARHSSAITTPAKPSAVPAHIAVEVAAATPTKLTTPAPRGARSPSAVPAIAPLEAPTRDDMNTSERYATLVPGSEEMSGATLRRQSTVAGTTSLKPQDSCHVVPIALLGHQRDAYPSLIRKEEALIKRFLTDRQPDDALVADTEALLKRLRAITIHPDLDNVDAYTQYDVPAATSAQWDVDSSAKFRFLKSLVDALRDSNTMLVVLAGSERLLHMLQTFFTGLGVAWESTVPFGAAFSEGLDVYVLDSRDDGLDWHSIAPDITLVIDGNVRNEKPAMLRDMPGPRSESGITQTVCSLVVPGTIEHVESCLSPHLTPQQKLRATVNGLNELLYDAGRPEAGQLSVVATAIALAGFVLDKQPDKEWPLTSISMLENLDSQTDSELDGVELGHKHSLSNGDAPAPKRARTETPNGVFPSTVNPMEIDMTHVSDSVARPSASASATESRLQALLQATQTRLAEHERALSDLQYLHEEQRIRVFDAERERDTANATAARAITRLTDQSTQIQTLRTERAGLQTQLVTAVEALASHAAPERAEFERLRQQVLKAENETSRLTRRLEAQAGDLSYFQSQYQSASNTAQTLANEVSELSTQLTALKLLASGEQGRAREQSLSAQSAALKKENLQMKARLAQLEAGTKFRDEELARLKEAGRGRMGTRGNSVPRSPRMGGSPQGSPAVSELGRGRLGRE
ncbi:hypothetical protein LTR95_005418 [Oleoguttula sp. CCFEE 5521]